MTKEYTINADDHKEADLNTDQLPIFPTRLANAHSMLTTGRTGPHAHSSLAPSPKPLRQKHKVKHHCSAWKGTGHYSPPQAEEAAMSPKNHPCNKLPSLQKKAPNFSQTAAKPTTPLSLLLLSCMRAAPQKKPKPYTLHQQACNAGSAQPHVQGACSMSYIGQHTSRHTEDTCQNSTSTQFPAQTATSYTNCLSPRWHATGGK